MAGLHKAKKSHKNRKWGRNAAFCLRYKNENRREKNKIVRLNKHLKAFPDDVRAKHALATCRIVLGL